MASIFKQKKLNNYFRKEIKDIEDIAKSSINIPDSLKDKMEEKKKKDDEKK